MTPDEKRARAIEEFAALLDRPEFRTAEYARAEFRVQKQPGPWLIDAELGVTKKLI